MKPDVNARTTTSMFRMMTLWPLAPLISTGDSGGFFFEGLSSDGLFITIFPLDHVTKNSG
ncbi:MAG: hypothetical protein WBE34_20080 [Candidatus Nitrosopolaris sp.]